DIEFEICAVSSDGYKVVYSKNVHDIDPQQIPALMWNIPEEIDQGIYEYSLTAIITSQTGEKIKSNPKKGVVTIFRQETKEVKEKAVSLIYDKFSIFDIEISELKYTEIPEQVFTAIQEKTHLHRESKVYKFDTPAIVTFDEEFPAILSLQGQIKYRLVLYQYNSETQELEKTKAQSIDYANKRIIAEITDLSPYYALFVESDIIASEITNLSAEPTIFSPNSDGIIDTTVISYTLSDNFSPYIP
ncbi:unnamed protein product, partial [marine sediment metagenome]